MNSTDSPTDELLEHDSLFNCDQSCIWKGNSYIDCCPASKFKAPVRKACTICGIWIADTTDWIKHHFSARHLKSICYLSSFRQKCKANQDNEGVVIPPANISMITDSISYEQELFQMCGGSTFICAVCGSGVYDVIEHLKSMKHNESYLNVLYPENLTKIKEECLTPTGVDWNQYERRILTHLSENQPKADVPLTIFALKDDSEFNDWIWKCMMAFSTFTQLQNIPICIPELLANIIPADIQSAMTGDDCVLYNSDSCMLCRTKVFCSDSFNDHCENEVHVNKKKLFKFLKESGKYKITPSRSSEQSTIESLKEPFIGCETIIELTDSNDKQKGWCCAMCLAINGNVKKICEHLCSAKHIANYLSLNYVDLEICTSSIAMKLEELKHHASEIMKNLDHGRIQVAELIDASVADLFESLGEKLETVSSDRTITNGNSGELSDDLVFIENEIKLLFSDKKEDLFWCENCNNYVLVNKNKDDAKRLWNDHVTSENHLKIKDMKPKFVFDLKNFVDEKPSNIIMDELLRPGICIIGGNYMVERKTKDEDGQLINDIACLLCFELMPLEKFADHIHSRAHIKQFLHKEEPKLMRQILTEPGREDDVIENYFKQRPIRKGVRVYNPIKSEYLTNEYERLKKQIAEKERVLEEKRREQAEEIKLEELRRKSKDNDEKKLMEQRRIAELEKIEKIKREENERQARVLQNIRRMKERQGVEQKYLLEQKRLHQRLQEERQKKKDEEKKKLEERRILDLMKKEKEALTKKEEEDKQSKKNAAVVAATRSFYQQAFNPEQLSKDRKIDNGQTQKPAYKVAKETKWQPLNDQTFQKFAPELQQAQKTAVKNVAQGKKVADQKDTNQKPDPLMDSLKNSALVPIRPPLNAYIHPISVTCPEPLIGLELIYEFECSDDSFEPGYFCSLCTIKCLAKEIIKHVISVDHRMLYLEKAYKPLYGNIMKIYKEHDSNRNAAAIKQYAAQVERQDGRKRIENRLFAKVSSAYLYTKKPSLFCTPSLWDSSSTAAKEPSRISKYPTSVPPPPGVVSPVRPILPLVANITAPPPFIATSLVTPVATVGFLPISGGSKLVPQPVPPPPGTTTIQEIEMKDSTDWDWDNKCAKFLEKLTSKDDYKDGGTGQKLSEKSSTTKTAATPSSQKKPVELPSSVKKSMSRERDTRRSRMIEKRRRSSSRRRYSRSRSRSRKRARRSRSRSKSRRSPDRRRRRSPSPVRAKNSKSNVDFNGQQNNNNREPLPITPAAATPAEETLPPLQSKQKVMEPLRRNKQAADAMDYTPEATLSAEEVQVLQQLAKKDPVALERFMLQNPQVLRALLNREEQQARRQLKEKTEAPMVNDSRQVETPRRRVLLQPDPIVAQKSTASSRNKSQILSLQDELKDKLSSNADYSNKQSLTRQSMTNQDYGAQKSTPSAEALLMKILADEEEKKRKQAQNEKIIYDLLKQVDEITNQSKNKQVYDYSHGGGGSTSSQDKIRGMSNVMADENFNVNELLFKQKEKPIRAAQTATISWPPAEFDSLISDASLNVQQAKQQALGSRGGGGPAIVPENINAAANHQSFAQQYSNFSFSSKADSANSDLQNSLRAKYEQSRMEKNKELETKRREAFDKLAKDLCAPNSAAAGVGLGNFATGGLSSSRSDPMEDIEQILNIARVQSQKSGGILPPPQQQQQQQQQQPRQSSNFDYSSYLGYNYQNRNG